jgi:hypothetical protein
MKYWNTEPNYDPGRMIQIARALEGIEWKSLVDIACGEGIIAEGLSWIFKEKEISQFDIKSYPEWKHLRVRTEEKDLVDFIKEDRHYDVVLFLNSYRNGNEGFGEVKDEFDAWLKRNAVYFITSGTDGDVIGEEVKGHNLIIRKV